MNIRMPLQVATALILATMAVALPCHAQTNEPAVTTSNKVLVSARVYPHVEYFEWTETLGGRQFVKETGPLYGIGGEMELRLGKSLLLVLGADFFAGEVDYDGAIQELDGSLTPSKSTTTYVGIEGGIKLAAPLPVGKDFMIKPAAGIGLRTWERTLDTSFDSRYIGAHGYIEDWFTSHGILGLTVEYAASPATKLYVSGELRLPIWTTESIDLSNVRGPDDVEVEPKAQPSYSGEAGVRYKKFFAAAFVETLDFNQSDYDSKYGQFLQPKSEATITGGKIGLWF